LFRSRINDIPKPFTILDIGGTQQYWQTMDFNDDGISITLLNLYREHVSDLRCNSISGDATDLQQFPDKSVEVIHSNSVIEHLFTKDAQARMANEVRRVAKNYFVQTPNYFFPVEPHWIFPFFQFLPFTFRVWLTQHFSLGHIRKIPDRKEAEKQVREVRLLTYKELRELFPEATIYREKCLFFTKSYVAYYFEDSCG
jgi:ubiquinone/menaquinone biosynthesis C-methylase UbiE